MSNSSTEIIQKQSAHLAGFMYLFVLATSLCFLFMKKKLFFAGGITAAGKNIMANEWLFRSGIAIDLLSILGSVILSLALYTILKPVNRNLALLALAWRLGEAAILGINELNNVFVLLILSGSEYLSAFDIQQLHAMSALFLKANTFGFNIGVAFSCCGAAVFNYLFFKSKFVPRTLALWGVFSSILALLIVFTLLLQPNLSDVVRLGFWPIIIDEVLIGCWLLIKGVDVKGVKLHIKKHAG